jgi:6-pyruvoyltetrahydropterin/6-carboxytetrahydropterin synthase
MDWPYSSRLDVQAAHSLPHAPEGHKCRRLHGHSFAVTINVTGPLTQPEGWVCDFADLTEAWRPLHDQLDHRHLNEIAGLENPTSEILAAWIWKRLLLALPALAAVEVAETCTPRCVYRGP